MVRHFLLAVERPAQARRQLGRLVGGDEFAGPQITTAADWHVGFEPGPGDDLSDTPVSEPDYCLNIGLTWPGLVALEVERLVPDLSFESFGAFIEGAAQRAELVGDTGPGRPRTGSAALAPGKITPWSRCTRSARKRWRITATGYVPGSPMEMPFGRSGVRTGWR